MFGILLSQRHTCGFLPFVLLRINLHDLSQISHRSWGLLLSYSAELLVFVTDHVRVILQTLQKFIGIQSQVAMTSHWHRINMDFPSEFSLPGEIAMECYGAIQLCPSELTKSSLDEGCFFQLRRAQFFIIWLWDLNHFCHMGVSENVVYP